jgi:hypothetical protein
LLLVVVVGACGPAPDERADSADTSTPSEAAAPKDVPADGGGPSPDGGVGGDSPLDQAAHVDGMPEPVPTDGGRCPLVAADGGVPDLGWKFLDGGAGDSPPQTPPPPQAACVRDPSGRLSLSLPAGRVVHMGDCFKGFVDYASTRVADPSVATVDGNLVLVTLKPGTTSIERRYGLYGLSVDLAVTATDIERIQVLPAETSLRLYQPQRWGARAVYRDGATADVTRWATWGTDDPGTVKFGRFASDPGQAPDHLFVPVKPGAMRVTTAFAGMLATTPATVSCQSFPSVLTLGGSRLRDVADELSEPLGFGVRIFYPDGESFGFGPVPVVASDPSVFGSNGVTGRCLKRGSTILAAALADRDLRTELLCYGSEDATAFEISPDDPINRNIGETVRFTAIATFPQGKFGVTAAWSSSDPGVASFGAGADASLLTAHRRGATVVTARYGSLTATRTIVVPQ